MRPGTLKPGGLTPGRIRARRPVRASNGIARGGRAGRATLVLGLLLGGLTACTGGGGITTESPSELPGTTEPVTPRDTTEPGPFPLEPAGEPTTVESGLETPWSMVRLPSGSTLIDERDSGRVLERKPSGGLRVVGTVGGVRHGGEGGLLGLAVPPGPDPSALFAYYTSETDNRVVSMPLTGTSGSYRLGAQTVVLRGIPSASFHNGGRIAFGPDGLLYVTAGDAGDGTAAQDPDSLGGKILRVTADGKVPSTNPIPNSPVYSLGHRNPQGIAWDSRGILWATEFGQNRWDELNIIRAGANYGWPDIEGIAYEQGFVDPVFQWPTIEASPSGMAIVSDTIFIAALRGERLWVAYSTGDGDVVSALPWFQNTVGRLRDVIAGPEGTVWLLTNNTDGRGEPRQGDDRILQLPLAPRAIAR